MTIVTDNPDFTVPPPPISPDQIKEVIDTDVIVIGAGLAGLTAALSAAEAGARTIQLEKGPALNFRGIHNAAISSRLQRKEGVTVDKERLIYTLMETAAYRGNQRVINTWANNCDQVMDWLLDMAEAAGMEVSLDTTTKDWYFPNYPLIHVWDVRNYGMQGSLAKMLYDRGRKRGVELRFNTPAVRLLRADSGRVSGVIARDKQGNLIQFNTAKAVVLCSGDYGNDLDMVRHYCWKNVDKLPNLYHVMTDLAYEKQHVKEPYTNKPNTGDGQKMGMWIGAAIDDPPHCAMLFDYTIWSKGKLYNLVRQPWLYVNKRGERFMNEDLPWGYECAQIMQQPEIVAWSIWDAKWETEVPAMRSQCCKNMGPPTNLWHREWLDEAVADGDILTAGSIEELGRKMNVPVNTFRAAVERYNEMARSGKDIDFGKHPDRLTALEKPLYYAAQVTAVYLVILGGLKINPELQVLDTNGDSIPGLYAAGNVSGSFFGGHYPTNLPGLSHSRAWTFGRLAGLRAAAE